MIEVTRLEQTDRGTIGQILVDGEFVGYSLELPWRDNETNVSCIPTGVYPVVYEYSPKYRRRLYEVKDVPGRSEVKFHKANFLRDLLGCFGVGSSVGYDDDGNRAVWASSKAFDVFMEAMGGRENDTLTVRMV